jgi:hypothetical protein
MCGKDTIASCVANKVLTIVYINMEPMLEKALNGDDTDRSDNIARMIISDGRTII